MEERWIDLYDEYTHRPLERRVFLRRLAALAGGAAGAAAALPLLENNYARAALLPPGDPRLEAETIGYPGASGPVRAYVAKRKGGGRLPGVIVIHENRGLNPHIEDVARRAAVEGYVAIAPDLLSPLGGTPADEDAARQLIARTRAADAVANLAAAVAYLKSRADAIGKVGCVGFCWGGGMANQLAVHSSDVAAAVAFYGAQPAAAQVPKIKAKLLLHYAGLDDRINQGIPAYEAALKSAGVEYEKHLYEGANHAFHNDTGGARYDKKAAELAWRRTVEFLNAALKS